MKEILDLIRTESAAVVAETLDFLLYECSVDEAPSRDDVALWCGILQARGGRFERLAQTCRIWLEEEAL